MIEMLQQPRIQAGNTPKNTPKADSANNESRVSTKSDSSFDQHLNDQIKHTPGKEQQTVSGKKTVENQPVEEEQDINVAAETAETEQLVHAEFTDEIKLDTEADVLELVMLDVEPVTTEDPLQSDIDPLLTEQILPLDGNELPPAPMAVSRTE